MYIRESDEVTFQLEFTYCIEANADMVVNNECLLPVEYLHYSYY